MSADVLSESKGRSLALRDRSDVMRATDRAGVWTLWAGTALLSIAPVAVLLALMFGDSGRGIRDMLAHPALPQTLFNAVVLALGSALIAVVLGSMLTWMAHRLPPRSRWMSAIPMIPLMIPPVAGVIGWAFLLIEGPLRTRRIGYGGHQLDAHRRRA